VFNVIVEVIKRIIYYVICIRMVCTNPRWIRFKFL